MGEPQHKRAKLPPSGSDGDDRKARGGKGVSGGELRGLMLPLPELEIIHEQLTNKCLCPLQLPDILHTLSVCNDCFSSHSAKQITNQRKETLLYISMLALFFEVALRQQNRGVLCSRISEVVSAGAENEGAVIDILFGMVAVEDKYISYCAARALAALLLMLRGRACEWVLENIVEKMAHSDNLLEVGHCVEVVKRVIEWKDLDEHPLESSGNNGEQPIECVKITLNPADTQGANEVKYIATKKLDCKWYLLVNRLTHLINDFALENEHVIVSFITLWESLISVKANLSITDTKQFYSGLERLMPPLNRHTHPIVWRKVLDLYNEVLCYGSTLALQDVLAEEPCNLAHLIIRTLKDRRFLENVPCGELAGNEHRTFNQLNSSASNNIDNGATSSSSSFIVSENNDSNNVNSNSNSSENNTISPGSSGNANFLGSTNSSERTILHKVVLVALKSIAITVKETRCDSSSENSSRSGGSGSEDMDMAIIERSLRDVLRKLDSFVKTKLPFHPEAPMAEWMVRLFADQDDWLVESMVCGLDIYTGLGLRIR